MAQLTDSYNRKMDYLRISVTDRCNFRCQYCMPEDIKFQDKSHILTLEEMLTFAEACLELGVTKVRVTGGEPLVRRGVVMFVGWLKELGFEDVTMTTNGFLLQENLDGLVEAGLDRINISLDTLQPEKFAFITRRNHFEKVWQAVMAALETPLSPVKINAVAMRGVNDDEIADMAKLTLQYPMHVRFIELMPLNGDTDGSRFRSLFIPGREILDRATEELGDLEPLDKGRPRSPRGRVPLRWRPWHLRRHNAGLRTLLCPLQQTTPDSGRQDSSLSPHRPRHPRKGRHPLGRPDTGDPRSSLGDGAHKASSGPHPPRGVPPPHHEPDRGLTSEP